jgi:hypothetical protein
VAAVTWPAPQPGLLIRYFYLWEREEARAGREEGVKDRPCAPSSVAYGILPPGLMKALRERLAERWREAAAKMVSRTD